MLKQGLLSPRQLLESKYVSTNISSQKIELRFTRRRLAYFSQRNSATLFHRACRRSTASTNRHSRRPQHRSASLQRPPHEFPRSAPKRTPTRPARDAAPSPFLAYVRTPSRNLHLHRPRLLRLLRRLLRLRPRLHSLPGTTTSRCQSAGLRCRRRRLRTPPAPSATSPASGRAPAARTGFLGASLPSSPAGPGCRLRPRLPASRPPGLRSGGAGPRAADSEPAGWSTRPGSTAQKARAARPEGIRPAPHASRGPSAGGQVVAGPAGTAAGPARTAAGPARTGPARTAANPRGVGGNGRVGGSATGGSHPRPLPGPVLPRAERPGPGSASPGPCQPEPRPGSARRPVRARRRAVAGSSDNRGLIRRPPGRGRVASGLKRFGRSLFGEPGSLLACWEPRSFGGPPSSGGGRAWTDRRLVVPGCGC